MPFARRIAAQPAGAGAAKKRASWPALKERPIPIRCVGDPILLPRKLHARTEAIDPGRLRGARLLLMQKKAVIKDFLGLA